MRILITGANGFLGRHLVNRLELLGHQIIKVPHKDIDYTVFMQSFDYLFHLSAYGNHYNQINEREMMLVNVVNLFDILFLTKNVDYKAFINFSTSSVILPKFTIYAATKAAGEQLIKGYVSMYNKPIVNCRLFSIYGPGEADFRFIPTVIRSCMYGNEINLDPLPVHDWVYVEDCIDALLISLENPKAQTIEIGTGIKTTNLEIVKEIELITGKIANYQLSHGLRNYDNDEWYCRNPIKDWKPKYSLTEGLIKVYESIKKADTRN